MRVAASSLPWRALRRGGAIGASCVLLAACAPFDTRPSSEELQQWGVTEGANWIQALEQLRIHGYTCDTGGATSQQTECFRQEQMVLPPVTCIYRSKLVRDGERVRAIAVAKAACAGP